VHRPSTHATNPVALLLVLFSWIVSPAVQPARSADTGEPSSAATDRTREAAPLDPRLVLVFPFENESENRSLYWAGEAFADGLCRDILAAGGATVDRADRIATVEDLGLPALSPLTLATQIRCAEDSGAGTLVSGAFTASGTQMSIRARVIDVAAGRTNPWVRVNGSAAEIFALQREIFRALRSQLPGGKAPADGGGRDPNPPEDGVTQQGYEYVLKSFYEDAPLKRESYLKRAVEVAPGYLRASIELARLYRETEQLDKAAAALGRIVTRNAILAADAESLLAEIEMERERPQAAEDALRRSLNTHETARAHLLLARLALARADLEAARREMERSRALDPSDPDLVELQDALKGKQNLP
jgi:tetratricopeptide (TPR) repeat protein